MNEIKTNQTIEQRKAAEITEPVEAITYRKSTLREYFESIVFTAIIALFVTTFVVQAFKIPTGSMESNLLIGDHLLVNKFVYGSNDSTRSRILPYKEPKRGDVIVFKYPRNPEIAYVKRVIGLSGEKVEVRGRQVYIDDSPLEENYIQHLDPTSIYDHYGPVVVPEGMYFVLGDNRDNSQDSRYWGFVPRDHVIGKAFIIYWSFVTDRDEYRRRQLSDRIQQILDVLLNFFTKTRWERTFKVIR